MGTGKRLTLTKSDILINNKDCYDNPGSTDNSVSTGVSCRPGCKRRNDSLNDTDQLAGGYEGEKFCYNGKKKQMKLMKSMTCD